MFSKTFISSSSLHCFRGPRRSLFYAQPKKFYKNVTVFQSTHENYKHPVFQILLDQRKLRTPTGIHFHVPNQALAVAVAHEWDSQVDTIKRYTMPLEFIEIIGSVFTLCISLDSNLGPNSGSTERRCTMETRSKRQKENDELDGKISRAVCGMYDVNDKKCDNTTLCNRALDTPADEHDILVNTIMQYADTDTICFRCQEPDDLVKVQSLSWDPIINWVNKHYQIKPIITDSMTSLAKLSPLDKEKLTRYFNSYNIWGLTGIKSCVENLKSVYLTLAMLDGYCSVAKAVELSQIEMLFQVNRWGDVPSYHDVENADLNARVSAALFLALLSHHQRDIKVKTSIR